MKIASPLHRSVARLEAHHTTASLKFLVSAALIHSAAARAQENLPPAPVFANPVNPATAAPVQPANVYFKDGFHLQTTDGDFRLRIGGIVQGDARYFPQNTAPGPVDAFVVRSARIDIDASLGKYVGLRLNPELSNGTLQLFEAWGEIRFFPALRLRVGKFKVPFGLERLQNESAVVFIERGFPTASSPNRDLGIMLHGAVADGVAEWALGVFNGNGDNNAIDGELDSDKEMAARVFFHPFQKTRFVPLRELGIGGAFTYGRGTGTLAQALLPLVKSDGQVTIFRYAQGTPAAPENTALMAGQRFRATGQLNYYLWRLGLLGEYVWEQNDVKLAAVTGSVTEQAFQAYSTFLLSDDKATYTGVRPSRPLDFRSRGPGAWEIALRYSGIRFDDKIFTLKLADPSTSVRSATSYTVGLNWYLNWNAKMVLDFVRTEYTAGFTGGANRPSEDALLGRLQVSL